MKRGLLLSAMALLTMGSAVQAQNIWYVDIDEAQGPWTQVPGGGYDDGIPGNGIFQGNFYFFTTPNNNSEVTAWYIFDNNNKCVGPTIPAEPRPYSIETWVPAGMSGAYSIIEVAIEGKWGGCFQCPDVPWNGANGTNRQWMKRNQGNQGTWVAAGPGPQAPDWVSGDYPPCSAGGGGQVVWLKRGAALRVHIGFPGDSSAGQGVSAIRITEMIEDVTTCDPAVAGGPVDLRCMGNADPLLGSGADEFDSSDNDRFANAEETMIAKEDNTLAANNYVRPCTDFILPFPGPTPCAPGLPVTGNYTVQTVPSIDFKFRYDGKNSIKWKTGDNSSGPFDRDTIHTINAVAQREFLEGVYGTVNVLTVKNGGHNSELVVEAVYTDNSSEVNTFKLYEWFGSDGDATSVAVGVNGDLRSSSPSVAGFRRVEKTGLTSNGGNHDGAFLFMHQAVLNPNKNLKQIKLYVQGDERGFGGDISVLAVSLDSSLCGDPVFDSVGGGVGGNSPDGSVDQRDFGMFQACFTGSNLAAYDDTLCGCFDINSDSLIDDTDLTAFEACYSGPAVLANPNCD